MAPHDDSKGGTSIEPVYWPRVALKCVLLIALTSLAYYPALRGGFVFDDDKLVTENSLIRATDGLSRIWFTTEPQDYWPATNSSFWLEWRLWGDRATGYHVTNLVLHILSALLIWRVLGLLVIPGAFLAAVLFAVHPVNVESVAWIAQRKNTLAMVFFLLSVLGYLKSHQKPIWYVFSLFAFVLAMLSKGSVVVLPAVLLMIAWWQHRRITKRDWICVTPFLIVAIVLAAVNVWFQTHGTAVELRNANFAQRLAGAGAVVWFYLSKSLLPIHLAFFYPQWNIQTSSLLWWLPLIVAIGVTCILWPGNISQRESWKRAAFFTWCFFCFALTPVMGLADVGFMKFSLVADHYQYIAIIGVVAAVGAGWHYWHARAVKFGSRFATLFVIAIVGVLTALTWQQSELYADAITLYRAALVQNPNSWVAHNNLGERLLVAGDIYDARSHFEEALRLKSDYAAAHNNLGNALLKTGWFEPAVQQYLDAIRIKPDYAEPYANLALTYAQMNRQAGAIASAENAIRLARSQGDVILAERIEKWLVLYRAGHTLHDASPKNE